MNADERSGLSMLWRHKWLVVVPALIVTAATAAASYWLPERYRAEAVLEAVSWRASVELAPDAARPALSDRLEALRWQAFRRSTLEPLIEQYDLYRDERSEMPIESVVERMRRDVSVIVVDGESAAGEGMVTVAYASSTPSTATIVAGRLAQLLVVENMSVIHSAATGTASFLESEIDDLKARIDAFGAEIDRSRRESGGPPSRATVLQMEVLEQTYAGLLSKREEARMAADLERAQLGVQLRLLNNSPARPITPNRLQTNAAGAIGGLMLGLVLVVRRTRR